MNLSKTLVNSRVRSHFQRIRIPGQVAVLLVVLFVVSREAFPSKPETPTPNDPTIREVSEFLANYEKTLESTDDAEIRRLYVDDGRFAWFTDGRKLYRSPQDIVDALASLRSNGLTLDTVYREVEPMALSENLASLRAEFATQAHTKAGPAFRFAGVITMLLERSPTGQWRVLTGHSSTPGGPPGTGGEKKGQ